MTARAAWVGALALAAGCAGPAAAPTPAAGRAIALANADFELAPAAERCAPGWSCSMHADPTAFRFFLDRAQPGAGAASLCIERVKAEPWGIATQALADATLKGRRVRFSLALRTQGVASGAGPVAMVHNGSGVVTASRQRLVAGTQAWRRVEVEIDVPRDMHLLEVGALLEGPGRACVDDARLEVLEPAASAPSVHPRKGAA